MCGMVCGEVMCGDLGRLWYLHEDHRRGDEGALSDEIDGVGEHWIEQIECLQQGDGQRRSEKVSEGRSRETVMEKVSEGERRPQQGDGHGEGERRSSTATGEGDLWRCHAPP